MLTEYSAQMLDLSRRQADLPVPTAAFSSCRAFLKNPPYLAYRPVQVTPGLSGLAFGLFCTHFPWHSPKIIAQYNTNKAVEKKQDILCSCMSFCVTHRENSDKCYHQRHSNN